MNCFIYPSILFIYLFIYYLTSIMNSNPHPFWIALKEHTLHLKHKWEHNIKLDGFILVKRQNTPILCCADCVVIKNSFVVTLTR